MSTQTQKRGWRRAAIRNIGSRTGWVDRTTPRPLYPQGNMVSIAQEAERSSSTNWMGTENLFPTGSWLPALPARNGSPYQLRYTSCIARKELCRNPCTLFTAPHTGPGFQAISCRQLPGGCFGMRHSHSLPFIENLINLFHHTFRSTRMSSHGVSTVNRHNPWYMQ